LFLFRNWQLAIVHQKGQDWGMAKYVIFGITWGYSQDKESSSLIKPTKFKLRNFDFEAQPIYIVPNKRRIKKITEGKSTYHTSVMDRKVMLISKRDDHEIAQRIAESFLLCWGLFNESVLFGQYVEVYTIDEKFVVDNEFVLLEAFENYDMLDVMIYSHPTIFKSSWDKIWNMVEATIDEDIFEALRFYSESLNAYTVDKVKFFDGDLDKQEYPENFRERSEVEVAIVACCKAIEQLFGEPSSNKKKYKKKLIQRGVDPDEYVGYKGKEKIINKIYKFHNEIRNKKAAHGKTLPPDKRKISFLELLDLQTLTNYLIWKVIMHTLKEYGFNNESIKKFPWECI